MFSNTYHLSAKVFNQKKNSCAAALAYRVGVSVKDPYDGRMRYPRRNLHEIQSHFIFNWGVSESTQGRPETYQAIIDEIGRTETRCNSRLFREFEVALPHEGTDAQRAELVEEFARTLTSMYGVSALVGIHEAPNAKTQNKHAHLLVTTRRMESCDGTIRLVEKVRELDTKTTLKKIRKLWENLVNKYYRTLKIDKVVSCESYETLGIGLIPTIHEGPGARIRNGDRPSINRAIRALNKNCSSGATSPSAVMDGATKLLRSLENRKAVVKSEIVIIEDEVQLTLDSAKLNSRQRKQSKTLKQQVIAAMTETTSPQDFSEKMKSRIGRSQKDKNAFYRLKKSLPPAGGDEEVIRARDGIALLALLFQTADDETFEKLKRWSEGEVLPQKVKRQDYGDPFFLQRLHEWELMKMDEKITQSELEKSAIEIGAEAKSEPRL